MLNKIRVTVYLCVVAFEIIRYYFSDADAGRT